MQIDYFEMCLMMYSLYLSRLALIFTIILSMKVPNIGFKDWASTAVYNEETQYLDDNWEWKDAI